MRINGKDVRKMKSGSLVVRTIVLAVVAIIVSLVGILIAKSYKEALKQPTVEAEVLYTNSDDDESVTDVSYFIDGKEYRVSLHEYSSSISAGDTITLHYNPNDPYDVTHVTFVFPIIMLGIGLLLTVIAVSGVVRFVQGNKQRKEVDEAIDAGCFESDEEFLKEFKPGEMGTLKEYYFHFYGKMNQSSLMETPEREHVFEGNLKKFSLLSASEFEFVNCLKNTVTSHMISKTVTSSHNNVTTDSYFSFDGVNIHDYLYLNGVRIESELKNILNVRSIIYYKDQEIGQIVTAGTAILENVKSNKFTENAHTDGLYKIYCSEENIPLMFLIAFVFTHTGVITCD